MNIKVGIVVEVKKPNNPNQIGEIVKIFTGVGEFNMRDDSYSYEQRNIVRIYRKNTHPEYYL